MTGNREKRITVNLAEYDTIFLSKYFASTEQGGHSKNCRLHDEDRAIVEQLRNLKTGIEILQLRDDVRISVRSRVGHVGFRDFDLVIWPKFAPLKDGNVKENPLALLLQYAFEWKHLKRFGKRLTPDVFFADILVHELVETAREIQRRGPFQEYRKERRELSDLRGRLDFPACLKHAGIPSATLPCVYYRRSLDNILNRTLCAGLRLASFTAKSVHLKKECRSLADTFAIYVTENRLDAKMLNAAHRSLNRLNAHYEHAVRTVRLLYKGTGGFVHGEKHRASVRIPGFLFDMNTLFENVFARLLAENLDPRIYKTGKGEIAQKAVGLFSYDEKFGPGGAIMPGRPDIVVEKNDGTVRIVLDAKYKEYFKAEGNNAGGPSKNDLYQLSVYALTCSEYPNRTFRSTILYPAEPNAEKKPQKIDLKRCFGDGSEPLCSVLLRPIDMEKLAKLVSEGSKAERRRFALELIGENDGVSGLS